MFCVRRDVFVVNSFMKKETFDIIVNWILTGERSARYEDRGPNQREAED